MREHKVHVTHKEKLGCVWSLGNNVPFLYIYPYQTLVDHRLTMLAAHVLTSNNTTTGLARRHGIPQTVSDHIGTPKI